MRANQILLTSTTMYVIRFSLFQSKFNLSAYARKLNFVNLDHDVFSNIPYVSFQSKLNLRASARKLNFVNLDRECIWGLTPQRGLTAQRGLNCLNGA